jgi:small subunit ribosomal protein S7
MPRRRVVTKRRISSDAVYGSALAAKCINQLMSDGKRSTAERVFYETLAIIKEKTGEDPLRVFNKAVENVKPVLEVKSRRVGGSTYQVPIDVRQDRRIALALRWITGYASARSGRTMQEKLAAELLDAFNNSNNSGAIKKKEDTHKMAEANKAFAHYRW